MTQARINLDEYTTRVLDVVKGKYGLKNREDALNRFVKEFGGEFVDYPISEKYLNELDNKVEEHYKKYGTKSMSESELDEILNL